MHLMQTNSDHWFGLPRGNGVAYAAQESWIQNATVRENITFGSTYDETRYQKGMSSLHVLGQHILDD